jgi:hypothetical protein
VKRHISEAGFFILFSEPDVEVLKTPGIRAWPCHTSERVGIDADDLAAFSKSEKRSRKTMAKMLEKSGT